MPISDSVKQILISQRAKKAIGKQPVEIRRQPQQSTHPNEKRIGERFIGLLKKANFVKILVPHVLTKTINPTTSGET
jgi:hypothetical protein